MKINRTWAMPSKNTFTIKPVKELILRYAPSVTTVHSLDPFANTNDLASITNDLDPQYKTDYNEDGLPFLKRWKSGTIDLIFLDPPFSPTQVKRCYESLGMAAAETTPL